MFKTGCKSPCRFLLIHWGNILSYLCWSFFVLVLLFGHISFAENEKAFRGSATVEKETIGAKQTSQHQNPKTVRLGVLAKRGKERCREKWGPTVAYLNDVVKDDDFELVPLGFEEIFPSVKNGQIDFVLANSSYYVQLEALYGVARIVTLKNTRLGKPYTRFAGLIFCSRNREDIKGIDDLVDKTFMAVDERSFGGWQMAWYELMEHDINPYKDFSKLTFGGTHDAVVRAVMNGKVDAGTVRSDTLERMAQEGKIDINRLRIIHQHAGDREIPFFHSTDHYPEWPVARLKHTSVVLAEKVAVALLSMPSDGPAAKAAQCSGWTVPLNYQPVRDCLKKLGIGPFKHQERITLGLITTRYWPWIVATLIFLLMLLLFSTQTRILNKKLKYSLDDRNDAIKALKSSEKRYRMLFTNLNSAFALHEIILDTTGQPIDYRFLEVNPAFEKLTGLKAEEIIGQCVLDVLPSTDLKWLETYGNVAKSGIPINFEKFNRELGKYFSITAYAPDKNLFATIFQDITDRIQNEEELRKLVEAVSQASEGIVVTDNEGKIIFANPAFENITGYLFDEIAGQTPRFLKSGQQDLLFYAKLWDTILSGSRWKGNIINKRKDGSLYTAECSISPVKNNDGDIVNFVWMTRDITQILELEKRLVASQKIEAIGSLAGGIAHDFNNLLFPILGMAEMLMEDLPPSSPEHQSAEEIFIAARRASELVKQILAFSRQSEHKIMPIKIQSVLKEVLKLSRSTIPTNINLIQNIQKDCGLVMADPTQVHQIAINLITNAYHAVEAVGGDIIIRLKETSIGREIPPNTTLKSGPYAMLTVTDTGCGIDPNVIDRIFEPYYTTKEQGKGTGLGLAVVYGLVKDHRGDITVISEVDKGTTFTVYLPLTEKKKNIASVNMLETLDGGHERILLVDDEASVLRLEKQMLERLGYQVTVRNCSKEALEVFKSDPNAYDLVVSDMTMPNITGDQLAKEIMSIKPNIPIIICTGYSEKLNQETAHAQGISGFLKKPVEKTVLAKMVRKVLDEIK